MSRDKINKNSREVGQIPKQEVQEETNLEKSLDALELEAKEALSEVDTQIDGQLHDFGVQTLRDTNSVKTSFRERLGRLRDRLFPKKNIAAIQKEDAVLESVEPKYMSPKGVTGHAKTAEQRVKALASGTYFGYDGKEKISRSAYGHLHLASSGVERGYRMTKEDEDWDKAAGRVEQAASQYWREFIAGNIGDSRYTRDWMKAVTDPNAEEAQALFANMPEILRATFHSELVQHCREKGITSEIGKWKEYVWELERSFDFDRMVELLDATEPVNDVEALLERNIESKGYQSNHYEGIEDSVANMAIHRAALEIAGRQPDGWHIDEEEEVEAMKTQVGQRLPQFYERVYDSLRGHPTALVQAFKGLFKISTQYYSPAGSYQSAPGYMAYSKEGDPVNQTKYKYGFHKKIGDLQASMEGHLYAISTPDDVQGLIDFCAGKIDETPEFRSILALLHKRFSDDSKRYSPHHNDEKGPAALFREQIHIPGEQAMDRFVQVLRDCADSELLEVYMRRFEAGEDIFAGIDALALRKAIWPTGNKGRAEISDAFIDFVRSQVDSPEAATAIPEQARRLTKYYSVVGNNNHPEVYAFIFEDEERTDKLIEMLRSIAELPSEYKEKVLNDFANWSSRSEEDRKNHVERLERYHAAVGDVHDDSFNFVFRDESRADELLDILAETTELDDFQQRRLLDSFDTWSQYPPEKRRAYREVLVELAKSPSQEIQRIVSELSASIVESDDPVGNYRRVEDVFIKNNLPHVGKVYRVFEILYPDEKIDGMLEDKPTLSPYLQGASEKRRKYTIFSDLLRIHVETGNRSLEQYLQLLKKGEGLIAAVDAGGIESLSAEEVRQLEMNLARLRTLQEQRPESTSADVSIVERAEGNLVSAIDTLRDSLGVADGQQIGERIIELFASQLGYESIDQVLDAMRRKKQEAHDRGVALARSAKDGQLAIHDGDFVKGVAEKYIGSILQNGSVAREYLGSSSNSDGTPFDTDVTLVSETAGNDFAQIHDATPARKYGEISFVVRDRGQFEHTTKETSEQIDASKLEVFRTGVADADSHYGIRTGFPATEIDFMVRDEDKTQRQLEIEIAKNGYYIPIVDGNGKITFTPEQYDAKRAAFAGIERFGGPAFEYVRTGEDSAHHDDVEEMKRSLKENRETVDRVSKAIRREISATLDDVGISLKDAYDMGLLGGELLDTGSTGRETNLPHEMDFDLALKLDLKDQEKIRDIVADLKKRLAPRQDQSHAGDGGGDLYQLRYMGADLSDAGKADIDIAFVAKNEMSVYGSHDAVRDRLDWIRDNLGEAARDDVVGNILVAKKHLKLGEAYKKFEHGGFGGIGVENWILANGGNFERAARTFWKAADGGSRSLEEFREHYQIVDPGVNVKFMKHDNFVELLNEDGYRKMLETIQSYFDL